MSKVEKALPKVIPKTTDIEYYSLGTQLPSIGGHQNFASLSNLTGLYLV